MQKNINIQLNPKVTLFLVPIETPQVSTEQLSANNHIWLFDRSGSMSGTISDLVDTMVDKLKTLTDGDTLSIGWFSGERQYDFILKGHTINGLKSIDAITAILQKYASTVGCTCFSEILHKTDEVIADLKALNSDFSLVFFSDGYPVVSNLQHELTSITSAIAKLEGKLTSALVVGFGGYYNRELMTDMASQFGGTFVHSADLKQYSESLTEFIGNAAAYGRKTKVNVGRNAMAVFALNGSTVVSYRPDAVGVINYAAPKKGGALYVITDKNPGNLTDASTWSVIVPADYRAIVAAALTLNQRTKSAQALECLGALGEVALIDALSNAFTNDEHGKAETLMRKAITSPKERYLKGSNTHYLPKDDAFCVIDAVNLIMADESAAICIGSDEFEYNRISRKAVQKSGQPTFTKVDDAEVPATNMVWHEAKLNLSLQCKIPGFVKLDENAAKHGFAPTYPTYIFRNFTLVKDGNVNMPVVPMKLSKATISKLEEEGASLGIVNKNEVLVNFGALPVMNRATASGPQSAKNLCRLLVKELKLEAEAKVLRQYIKDAPKDAPAGKGPLSAEQVAYLESFCIGKNGFQPQRKELEATDVYVANEFNVKIKGFSSLPSWADYQKKLANGKPMTVSESLIHETVTALGDAPKKSQAKAELQLATVTKLLRQLRHTIQSVKFAILLGKNWFTEFKSREDNELEVDGFNFTFEVRKVEVKI